MSVTPRQNSVAAEVTRLKRKVKSLKLRINRSLLASAATVLLIVAAALSTGCASRSKAKLREQNAFLAGQNAVLMQQQAQMPGVTVVGPVQRAQVPWVAGLTLAQALATANYAGDKDPRQIIITRNGESAAMDANVLLNGADIPLQIGDVIELR
jgi:hypothetical protein